MTLRRTTLLVVSITFLGLIAALAIILEVTLIRHFNEIEAQSITQSIQRAEAALESDYAILEFSARELGRRVDAGDSDGQNSLFIESTIQEFQINLVALLDEKNNIVGMKIANVPFDPEAIQGRLAPAAQSNGVLAFQEGFLLISSQPVASGGMVITGRLLDEVEVQRLAASIHLPMIVMRYNDSNLPEDFQKARTVLSGLGSEFSNTISEETIAGYTLLMDRNSAPAAILRVDQPRTIYRSGRIVMTSLFTSLIGAGLVFALIMMSTLERMAISRITRLNQEVGQIETSGDVARRVTITGKDELASLSNGINGMLASLQQAEGKQRQHAIEIDGLFQTSRDFLALSSTTKVRDRICELAIERFEMSAAWIGTVSKDETFLEAVSACGIPLKEIAPIPFHWEQDAYQETHLAALALRTGEVGIEDPSNGSEKVYQPFESKFRSVAVLPLAGEFGRGAVLCLYSRQPDAFVPDQTQWFHSFSNLAGMGLEKVYLFEQVVAGRQRLQVLSRRLVEVQEEERHRIALELHDEIGQILTGLKLMLDTSLKLPAEEQRERLDEIQNVVNDLIGRVRQMSLDLRPAMLDDLGLLPALVWLFGRYSVQTNVRVDFQQKDIENKRFSSNLETAAFRIVQEALTNVARHAKVDSVTVQIWDTDNVLGIQVEDAGAGFEPDAAMTSGNTRGLLGMRERATSLGGRVTIDSAPGHGTCLTIELPLSGHLERRQNARYHTAGR